MYTIAALYRFAQFDDPAAFVPPLRDICNAKGIRGTLLLATEGINGTIAGTRPGIEAVAAHIRGLPGRSSLNWRTAACSNLPFARMKVRLKREIVTFGRHDVNPHTRTGQYVEPRDWNGFIRQDDVAVIDTRNEYETAIGTFEGAINPLTSTFREFPSWWEANSHRFHGKRVAMFCTGGIRCEKSTSYLLGQGKRDVYQLKGGILRYLQETPETESAWKGECFVFDSRVSVLHGLREGTYELCHGCRRPIRSGDKRRPEYEEGVSCHSCVNETSEQDKMRFRERQKQFALAQSRCTAHFAP